MKAAALLLALVTTATVFPGPRPAAADETLLVFAAASLADAMEEVGEAFTEETGAPVSFNFAGSNVLARQIAAGAPAQLFISADRAQVEVLERVGRVRPAAVFPLLTNSLVVIVPTGSEAAALTGGRDLLAFEHLALADPAAVPAGVYARQWLAREGLWEELEERVVPALDARAALAAVASGALDAGVVYATDAATSDRVRVVYRVPAATGPAVRYYAAPVSGEVQPHLGAFLDFLRGPEAAEVFRRLGFGPAGAGG